MENTLRPPLSGRSGVLATIDEQGNEWHRRFSQAADQPHSAARGAASHPTFASLSVASCGA